MSERRSTAKPRGPELVLPMRRLQERAPVHPGGSEGPCCPDMQEGKAGGEERRRRRAADVRRG
jgi:hypothetical protein